MSEEASSSNPTASVSQKLFLWLKRHRARLEAFNLGVSFLGLFAFFVSLWGLVVALKGDGLLTNIRGAVSEGQTLLTDIHQSVGTKYINGFPEDIRSLNQLLRTARREIKIMTDVAGYGCLSAHKDFREYVRILDERKAAGCSISVAIYSEASFRQFVQPLFDGMDLLKVKSDPQYAPYWDNLDYRYHVRRRDAIQNLEDFKKQLWEDEQHYRALVPGIDRYVVDGLRLPVHCWIVDGSRAFFTLVAQSVNPTSQDADTPLPPQEPTGSQPAYANMPDDQSIETSHAGMIQGLEDMIRAYSRPIGKPPR